MGRKIFLLVFILFGSIELMAQKRAMGLRVGDPIAITYKHYLQSDRAFEFMLGTASPNWRKNYYKTSFDKYSKYDDYDYRSHKLSNPFYLEARYLFHTHYPVDEMEGKLEWYWGLGTILKIAKVEYNYVTNDDIGLPGSDKRSNLDFGPEGIIGVEYTFEDIPLNVFGEVSLLIELADRPFALQIYGGVGARIIF